MKVIGHGAPERLTVRFAVSERALVEKELDDLRATMVEHLAMLQARPEPHDRGGSTVAETHAGLAALHDVLRQVERQCDQPDTFTVEGPTSFLGEVIHGVSHAAAESLLAGVTRFRDGDDDCSPQALREAAGAASAATATLIAYDAVTRSR